jgi:hypothetical protein
MKAAAYLAALDFEAQMKENGRDAVFWCGAPSEAARQEASEQMALERRALVPQGALPLSNPLCASGFDVNLLRKKVRLEEIGFSLFSSAGYAHAFPKNYEIGFLASTPGGLDDD